MAQRGFDASVVLSVVEKELELEPDTGPDTGPDTDPDTNGHGRTSPRRYADSHSITGSYIPYRPAAINISGDTATRSIICARIWCDSIAQISDQIRDAELPILSCLVLL